MILYQPVLFVGLGGTGCDIGAELERRMREEICGADGNKFRTEKNKEGMRAYQLPSCVQFVYADMNQAELDRLPRRVIPGPEYEPAVAPTAHYVTGLVPDVVSYPELSMRLRLEEKQVVEGWLPPWSDDEPRTNPLFRGAGQFPTIGRAALFGTFRDEAGIEPAVRDLKNAIGKLSNSGEDLRALGGRPPRGVDVFVAFSVAGGTGTGIFYDYLHLIADTIKSNSALRVKIYPLVLMPSAFPTGLGGGRPAELNAGRAMLDLFRLVDQQNGADAERELRGPHDPRPLSSEEVAVTYPRHQRIVMTPGVVQTAFLFSQPVGATREDMHRSIVSLVMSLVGTEMSEEDNKSGEHHQSFADSFVNEAAHRQVLADNGIGNRGVSTALVASMSVPIDELAGIVASRLLREAINVLISVDARPESTKPAIEEFLNKSGVHPVFQRQGNPDFSEPAPATGARDVTVALNNRRESMRSGIDALRTKLGRDVPHMVDRFNPDGAARDMLGKMDVFRLQRVVFGHANLRDEVEQGGAAELLQRRRATPPAPQGLAVTPPETPELNDRFFRKVQWADPPVVGTRNAQNAWYQWRTYVVWAEVWAAYERQWSPPLDKLRRDLSALTRALDEFARQDVEDFKRRSGELYRARVGVSYMLPAGSGHMDQFYTQVTTGIAKRPSYAILPNSTAADVVKALVGPGTWSEVYNISVSQSPEHAVSFLREKVKIEIKKFLREPPPGELPMLPRLHDLLATASGYAPSSGSGPGIPQDYLDEFAGKLAGLLPANFNPQGSGPLKVLVSYPADNENDTSVRYLKSAINLPTGARVTEDFRATNTESISVVLFRTGMGVTEVDEVRHVLLRWAGSLARPEPTDLLRWRQRTGYDFGYLATREDHRVRILHRLLNAMWNGRATILGPVESPTRINVELNGNVTMTLPLTALAKASSWGSLLRAYELWALDDNDIHRRFCGQLMRELPNGLDSTPERPSELYMTVRAIAEEQIVALDDLMKKQADDQRSRAGQMRGFWAETLPSALDLNFSGMDAPVAKTLRELEEVVDPGAGS
jgi:hypothetical protein